MRKNAIKSDTGCTAFGKARLKLTEKIAYNKLVYPEKTPDITFYMFGNIYL